MRTVDGHTTLPHTRAPIWSISRGVLLAVAVVLILALAAWLRLWHLDLVEFKNDEAWALRLAEDMVRLGQVPLVGLTTSLGVPNPPDFIYFLAPAVALTRDPRAAAAAVALANVAGVAGVVLLGWRMMSPLGGLVAGLALATNPWAVFYARKIWAQEILAPLAVVLFVALDKAVMTRNVGWAVATFPIFAVGVQMHFSFGLLGPLMLAPLGALVVHRRLKELALGVCLALLTTVPYLVHNQQTDWAEVSGLYARLAAPAVVSDEGPNYVQQLVTGLDKWFVATVHLEHALPVRVVELAANLETVLLGLGIVVALVLIVTPRAARPERRWRLVGLLLWLVLPAALTIRHAVPLYEHYYLFVPPAAALLIAVGVHSAAQRVAPWGRALAGLVVGCVIVLASIHTLMVARLINHLAIQYEPSYGEPLVQSEAIAQELVGFASQTGAQHLVMETWPDSEPIAYLARPFISSIQLVDRGDVGLGPRLGGPPARSAALPEMRLLGPAERPQLRYPDGVEVWSTSTLTHLVSGQRAGLAMTWTATDPAAAGVAWEVGLYDPAGQQVAHRSGVRHNASAIAHGQPITSWFVLDTDGDAVPGRYGLRVRRVDQAGLPLPIADSLDTGTTEWLAASLEVVSSSAR